MENRRGGSHNTEDNFKSDEDTVAGDPDQAVLIASVSVVGAKKEEEEEEHVFEPQKSKPCQDSDVKQSVLSLANCVDNLELVDDKGLDRRRQALAPERALLVERAKKLLVLDLNGLLADIIKLPYSSRSPKNKRINGKSVFKRPFCDDFLSFCFQAFHVGVWSSRQKRNIEPTVDYLLGDMKHKLLFCWVNLPNSFSTLFILDFNYLFTQIYFEIFKDQSKCTTTSFKTLENHHKPLILKELNRIWDFYWRWSPSNTLLVDDSPYKSLCNPPHTAIFPDSYSYMDEKDDTSLGPGGDIRVYLQGLAMADDIRSYVQGNKLGQPAITQLDRNWDFYQGVLKTISTGKKKITY